MATVGEIGSFLDSFAPRDLAESWDNVGLILGDPGRTVDRVMTCLTITPESASEAIKSQAGLIVTHHPLPFRPLQRITTEEIPSRLVWELAGAKISVYSPHTAFDSAEQGINASLAKILGLQEVAPLTPHVELPDLGSGRVGMFPEKRTLADVAAILRAELNCEKVEANFSAEHSIQRVGIACGSGGSFLSAARRQGCDCLVTGEATFHTILEATAYGIALVQVGHYASERIGVERLAQILQQRFADCEVWASTQENCPRHWL